MKSDSCDAVRGACELVELAAYVPPEVRRLAVAAYHARARHRDAMVDVGHAMRAFADACRKHAFDPASIMVGELSGDSLVPASTAQGGGE